MRSALYEGTLIHARRRPRATSFAIRSLTGSSISTSCPSSTVASGSVLGATGRTSSSFRDRDHFDGGPSAKQAVLDLVGDSVIERVLALTMPRVLGYVFNPVSFYWCYRSDGSLVCIVAELNNTFGERLPEVLRGSALEYEHAKRLHVSPFFGLDQSYEWAFSEPAEAIWARIHVREEAVRPFTAVLHARRRELTNASVARTLARYPLMPLQVTALIHRQALRLWLKRVPFHHKPAFVSGEGSVR